MQTATTLSIDDLAAFDPHHRRTGGDYTHVCCPLCGGDKRVDQAHRSLSYSEVTGAYWCRRCDAKGKLKDFWTERERPPAYEGRGVRVGFKDKSAQARARFALTDKNPTDYRRTLSQLNQAGTVSNEPPAGATVKPITDEEVKDAASGRGFQAVTDGPGAAYLAGRGLDPAFCHAAQVRFTSAFRAHEKSMPAPAVVFPIRDGSEKLVALQGRFTNGDERRMRSKGGRKLGVFSTPGALDKKTIPVFVEAPLDALSLATAGIPAIALCGSSGVPDWLVRRCALRPVIAAFDKDEAGDKAAVKLAADMSPVGGMVKRLSPISAKDWNAILQNGGVDALRAELKPLLAMIAQESAPLTIPEDPKPEPVETTQRCVVSQAADADDFSDLAAEGADADTGYAQLLDADPAPSAWARELLAGVIAKEIEAWREAQGDNYPALIRRLRDLATEGRLPMPAPDAPLTLRSGHTVPDPNRFLCLAVERIQALRSQFRFVQSRTMQERIGDALAVHALEVDQVARWYAECVKHKGFHSPNMV